MPVIWAERMVIDGSSKGPKPPTTNMPPKDRSSTGFCSRSGKDGFLMLTSLVMAKHANPTITQKPTVTPAASVGENFPV